MRADRIRMLKIPGMLAWFLAAQIALAEGPAVGDKSPTADPVKENTATTESTAAAGKKDEAFKPPRGFKTKKRGDLTLYCQTDATVGTRFKTEKCYDEAQLRAYMLVLEAQRRDVDRIRTNCGGGPCTPYEPPTPR
jgi:hypothetical protein